MVAFELVAEVWAEVILPSTNAIDRARESALASRTVVERIVHFAMRWPVDIAAKDRIIWNDEPYGVEGNVPNPKGGEIVVTGRFASGTDG